MAKILPLLISLGVGGFLGYYFDRFVNNIALDILIGVGFFIATLLALVILFFLSLFLFSITENMKKVRKYQSKYYRAMLIAYCSFLFSLFGMKLHLNGIEQLSTSEIYVIVCNHRSNLDSLIIDHYLKRFPLVFVTKESLFKVPFIRKFIHGAAYLKLNRKDLSSEFETFALADEMLTRSDNPLSIGIFPEGTRNKDDDPTNVAEFKAGSFRMPKKAMCPIVISALRGTKEVNNKLLTSRHHVYLDIIEVLSYESYKDWDYNQISLYCHDKIENFLKENK